MQDQAPPAFVRPINESVHSTLADIIAEQQAKDAAESQALTVAPPSKDSTKQNVLRALIYALGAGLDIHSTNKAMHVPGLSEQNSWLYGKHPSLGRLVGTKAALGVPLLWSAHKAAEKFGKVEGMMPVAVSSAWQTGAALGNYHTINQQKKKNGGGE